MFGYAAAKSARTASSAAPSSSDACQPENTTFPDTADGSYAGDAATDVGAEPAGLVAVVPTGLGLAPPPPVQAPITNMATRPRVKVLRRIVVPPREPAWSGAGGSVSGRPQPADAASNDPSLCARGHASGYRPSEPALQRRCDRCVLSNRRVAPGVRRDA